MRKRLFLSLLIMLGYMAADAQYRMEYLNRGLVATPTADGKVFISWRLLGDEPYNTAFNLYKTTNGRTIKLNAKPIEEVTSFLDPQNDSLQANVYTVKKISKAKEEAGFSFLLKPQAQGYLSLPLQTPAGYAVNDASVGDMDGADNSRAGFTDPPIFQCYTLDGKMLWQINLGKNIREGAHYTQFMVYDLDGDGKAEIAMKTADGTIDGTGQPIGDSTKNHRNQRGYILSGPEYLTVFNGLTGAAMSTVAYDPPRHPDTENPTMDQLKQVWGDGYGNI